MKIHCLQHVPFEGLASIEIWAKSNDHFLSATRFYQGELLPEIEDIDWLVVMGGPMNIYEENKYPWLVKEKKFIEQAIKHEKIILGICLGSQLIADVLGANVSPNTEKEIGWFPIELTPEAQASPVFNILPNPLTVFHCMGIHLSYPKVQHGWQRVKDVRIKPLFMVRKSSVYNSISNQQNQASKN